MPLYVAARGGINGGVAAANVHNPYQGTIAVGLMPFLSSDGFFEAQRSIPDSDLIPTISMLFVHELGHLLNRGKRIQGPRQVFAHRPRHVHVEH